MKKIGSVVHIIEISKNIYKNSKINNSNNFKTEGVMANQDSNSPVT